MLRTKFTRDIKIVDLEGGRVNAVVSTEETDRMGDIVRVEGWDFDNFMRHPVLLASHNYYSMQAQIGEWEDMQVKGKKVVGTAKYYIGQGNDDADWGFKLAQKGMAAYSVGFNPDMDKAEPIDDEAFFPTYEFKGQELLEVSHVTIPANASALQQMKTMALDPILAEVVDEAIGEFGPIRTSVLEIKQPLSRAELDLVVAEVLENVEPWARGLFEQYRAERIAERAAAPPTDYAQILEDAYRRHQR
tara:strand:- start:10989 stop:11726 length:738 start_codon:yes stop_codon:yes gene_type:complete